MCCGRESRHGSNHRGHRHGGSCACGGYSLYGPAFWIEKEKIGWLEEYLEGLREEPKAVGERIAALKGEE
jgi:hypothetical protein